MGAPQALTAAMSSLPIAPSYAAPCPPPSHSSHSSSSVCRHNNNNNNNNLSSSAPSASPHPPAPATKTRPAQAPPCPPSPSSTNTITTTTTTTAATTTNTATTTSFTTFPSSSVTTITTTPFPSSYSSSSSFSSSFSSSHVPTAESSESPSPSPSTASLNTWCGNSSQAQTPSESLRRYPTDLTSTIPEEGDEETSSESFANEPVTPVSGRQSRDFRYSYSESQDIYHNRDSACSGLATSSSGAADTDAELVLHHTNKEAILLSPPTPPSHAPPPPPSVLQQPLYAPPPPPPLLPPSTTTITTTATATVVTAVHEPLVNVTTAQTEHTSLDSDRRLSASVSLKRPTSSARRASQTITRAMSSLFRRSTSQVVETPVSSAAAAAAAAAGASAMEFREPNYHAGTSESTITSANKIYPNSSRRRFSYHRSVATTRSNTPPSPGSPLEMTPANNHHGKSGAAAMPTSNDFMDNHKKTRAYTGLSLRSRVNFASARNHVPRRTRSLERKKKNEPEGLTRHPWAIAPEAGTGMKARRLSLSLPDDFTVDVAELAKEFEYQHKFLGRHGKHLGKGATSKVTLMVRKGSPGELYAVKEFRHKSSSETVQDYEKKIKSEYSIAKSLHHPNIVETVRLCTDHGRWNHVMEYCSEGDLFNLVSKKYLGDESRGVDRLCLFKQLCQGINYLHSHGIAHRDIKLENLLITKDSKLKITDFGVSEVFSGIHPGLREAGGQCGIGMGDVRLCKPGICGSLPYIAPEVLSKKVDYDPRALDVWSSAIVMLYLTFSANLWNKAEVGLSDSNQRNYNELVSAWDKLEAKKASKPDEVAKDAYPKVLAFEYFIKPVPLRRLLLNMLNPDPQKRITMNEVITNRWMKNVECCQLESYDDPVKYIDVSKKDCMQSSAGKIYCHNHLPPVSTGHGLPPMPGKPGY